MYITLSLHIHIHRKRRSSRREERSGHHGRAAEHDRDIGLFLVAEDFHFLNLSKKTRTLVITQKYHRTSNQNMLYSSDYSF